MTISVYRTADAWWAGSADAVAKIDTDATTTAQLLADRPAIDRAAASTETVPVSSLELLSPVTAPCRVVAQMTNFASHVKDAGGDPKKVPLTFFRKASGSITGPVDDIVKPAHVRLLDYEVEIGLVIGARHARRHRDHRRQPGRLRLRSGGDQRRVGARCAADQNPVLRGEVVPDVHPGRAGAGAASTPTSWVASASCGCSLRVNGELRQDSTVDGDMIYRPVQALAALARFQQLSAGDLVIDRHPGRHGAVRAAQAGAEARWVCCRTTSSGRCSSPGRPRTPSTCTTAMSSRPASPPTTARSISARNATW